MLRPCWIETVHVDDLVQITRVGNRLLPLCSGRTSPSPRWRCTCMLTHPHTFMRRYQPSFKLTKLYTYVSTCLHIHMPTKSHIDDTRFLPDCPLPPDGLSASRPELDSCMDNSSRMAALLIVWPNQLEDVLSRVWELGKVWVGIWDSLIACGGVLKASNTLRFAKIVTFLLKILILDHAVWSVHTFYWRSSFIKHFFFGVSMFVPALTL